jgi:hypothetical protein
MVISIAHPLELTSFVLDGKVVSNDRRGKTALRAERRAFQWHKAVCFRDATNEVFRGLHLRPLGTNQSEDHRLVIRDVPERCKRARPIIVVFEEKSTPEVREGGRSGRIIAATNASTFLLASLGFLLFDRAAGFLPPRP